MYLSYNPFTQIVEKSFSITDSDELSSKMLLSFKAFNDWKSSCFQLREQLLNKVADLLEERMFDYGKLITFEMGKPISQATAEVEKCAGVCRYFATHAVNFLESKTIESSATASQINFEPLGTIFGVMPWNFPFWQIFRFLAPTIMAGNSVLLKHASNVPLCAEAIEQVFLDAGAPIGVFQNLFVSYSQVETVIASPIVKAVTFTGSNVAGSIIAELAGKYTKKSLLELGGSDSFIIFEDADLNAVLENAIMSRFLNAGQSCIAAKRILVHQDIAGEFISNFQSLVENLSIGNPMDKNTYVGPMVNQKALNELHKQVQKTIQMGATCLTGGYPSYDMTSVYMPTLLVNIPYNSPIWQEEVFGPVAAVEIFETNEQAIEMANDTNFGLGASIWTEDMDIANWASKSLNVGMVSVNSMLKSEPALPFGGINESGYGRELGGNGILEFVNAKTVSYFS
ncbi:MAG: NAD-dependent succinate-semialdehyde dehydrogenase [Salinivirgaceae bacterium]|jgi:succinate-semialdehyde dehydrogenase/glutarate-semialdehyde dehydrogenase|nr:NAD-dependent succinate-semialdehyde dehydrogenase [Salinivirgaceae bacterium]